jgi:hypothetical protein
MITSPAVNERSEVLNEAEIQCKQVGEPFGRRSRP